MDIIAASTVENRGTKDHALLFVLSLPPAIITTASLSSLFRL